jgi:2Fe-2S ferredoxin
VSRLIKIKKQDSSEPSRHDLLLTVSFIDLVEDFMGIITFVEHDGTQHMVDIEEGKSLMQTAMDNLVPGIDADCGGSCACGTCHVIVDPEWVTALGSASEEEILMLDMTPEKSASSRLSCQVTTSASMDGMVVRLPEFQM